MKARTPSSSAAPRSRASTRITSVVGDGGFGVVYRGVHTGFGEPIAVKCLKLPLTLDEKQREGFMEQLRDEGRLLHRLSKATPGIVQALRRRRGDHPPPGGCPTWCWSGSRATRSPTTCKARRGPLSRRGGRPPPRARRPRARRRPRDEGRPPRRQAAQPLRRRGRRRHHAQGPRLRHRQGPHRLPHLHRGARRDAGAPVAFTPRYGAPEQFNRCAAPAAPGPTSSRSGSSWSSSSPARRRSRATTPPSSTSPQPIPRCGPPPGARRRRARRSRGGHRQGARRRAQGPLPRRGRAPRCAARRCGAGARRHADLVAEGILRAGGEQGRAADGRREGQGPRGRRADRGRARHGEARRPRPCRPGPRLRLPARRIPCRRLRSSTGTSSRRAARRRSPRPARPRRPRRPRPPIVGRLIVLAGLAAGGAAVYGIMGDLSVSRPPARPAPSGVVFTTPILPPRHSGAAGSGASSAPPLAADAAPPSSAAAPLSSAATPPPDIVYVAPGILKMGDGDVALDGGRRSARRSRRDRRARLLPGPHRGDGPRLRRLRIQAPVHARPSTSRSPPAPASAGAPRRPATPAHPTRRPP